MSKQSTPQINDRITVVIGDNETEIFMSFNLLQKLSKKFPDPQQMILIPLDPEARETIMRVLLKVQGEDELPEITQEVASYVINWAVEHLSSFFVRQSELMLEAQGRLTPLMESMMKKAKNYEPQQSSQSGSES